MEYGKSIELFLVNGTADIRSIYVKTNGFNLPDTLNAIIILCKSFYIAKAKYIRNFISSSCGHIKQPVSSAKPDWNPIF